MSLIAREVRMVSILELVLNPVKIQGYIFYFVEYIPRLTKQGRERDSQMSRTRWAKLFCA